MSTRICHQDIHEIIDTLKLSSDTNRKILNIVSLMKFVIMMLVETSEKILQCLSVYSDNRVYTLTSYFIYWTNGSGETLH